MYIYIYILSLTAFVPKSAATSWNNVHVYMCVCMHACMSKPAAIAWNHMHVCMHVCMCPLMMNE